MIVIHFSALSWKKKKWVPLKKNPLCWLRLSPFFENIDLFDKEEGVWIIPQGPVVKELYNILSVKLDSPVEVHSSVLLSTYFFQFINVSVLQREFRDHYLQIGF